VDADQRPSSKPLLGKIRGENITRTVRKIVDIEKSGKANGQLIAWKKIIPSTSKKEKRDHTAFKAGLSTWLGGGSGKKRPGVREDSVVPSGHLTIQKKVGKVRKWARGGLNALSKGEGLEETQ